MDIKNTYIDWIIQNGDKEQKEKYKNEKNMFRASSAGSCWLKQLYKIENTEEKYDKRASAINLYTGTIVHEAIQKSLEDHNVIMEKKVVSKKLNIVGHFDIYNYEENELIDIKTISKYAYSKKFGHKKNRDQNPSIKHSLQVGTYKLIMEKEYNMPVDTMNILYFRKDDGFIKKQEIPNEYADIALQYWEDLNEWVKDPIIEPSGNIPIEDWECRYCPYSHLCQIKGENSEG